MNHVCALGVNSSGRVKELALGYDGDNVVGFRSVNAMSAFFILKGFWQQDLFE